jgi:dolichyl-phosphate beta-glucosyltransferase
MSKASGKKNIKKILSTLVGIAISLLAISWLAKTIEGEDFLTKLKQGDLRLLLAAALLMVVSYLVRALRWPFFFNSSPPSLKGSYRCVTVGFFMNNVLPARMGEFVRAHLGSIETGLGRTRVLATIAGERLLDGIAISMIFAITFLFGSSTVEKESGVELLYVALLFAVAGICTIITILFREQIFSTLKKIDRKLNWRFSTYALSRIHYFIEELEPMLRPRRCFVLTVLSLLIWMNELFICYIIGAAFKENLSFGATGLFLAAVNFSSLVPAAPSGIGVIEAFTTRALSEIGMSSETALVLVLSQHLMQFLIVFIPGVYFTFLNPQQKSAKLDSGPTLGDCTSAGLNPSSKDLASALFSFIIPAYNEENRLPQTIAKLKAFIEKHDIQHDVIIVDDGSSDQTAAVDTSGLSSRILRYEENRGKGYAVRHGIEHARGDFVLFMDADGATPIAEFEQFISIIREAPETKIIIGSRALASTTKRVMTTWHRKFIGRIFNSIVNFMIVPGIRDTQCGFKLFSRDVAKYLFSKATSDGFSFDVEILFLARKAGYKIVEIPINWSDVPGSKVDLFRDPIRMFSDIISFRIRDLNGHYEHSFPERSNFISSTTSE